MLKQRLLTALVLIPLVIWGVYSLPVNYLSGIFSAFVLMAAWEWSRLSEVRSVSVRIAYVLVLAILMWNLQTNNLYFIEMLYIAALWWLLALVWLCFSNFARNTSIRVKLIKLLAGVLVLLPTWIAVTYVHGSEQYGPSWLLYMLVFTWVADSGAYFAGKQWGRTRLAASISPGKTREGVYGSFVLIIPYALVGGYLLGLRDSGLMIFVTLSIFLVPVSVLGDLFESLIKRHSGFKDSGVLLPGHGGVMDRIDSLTAVAPLFLLGLQVFM